MRRLLLLLLSLLLSLLHLLLSLGQLLLGLGQLLGLLGLNLLRGGLRLGLAECHGVALNGIRSVRTNAAHHAVFANFHGVHLPRFVPMPIKNRHENS